MYEQVVKLEDIKKRFWVKVNIVLDGCWEWQAATSNGYGKLTINGKGYIATRVSWWLETGAWPDGFVLHRCDNPRCVRFDHLFLGDQTANMRDAAAKGRVRGFKEKEFCKHGHPLSGDNLGFINSKTRGKILRYCKACSARVNAERKQYKQEWYKAHRILKNNGLGRKPSL